MKIGICDDDRIWRLTARDIIKRYAEEQKRPAQICCFEGEEELLAEPEPVDLLFLDIELTAEQLGRGAGIRLGEQINRKWPNCRLVFLTDYLSYALDVYRTEHLFFVVKEQLADRLPEVFAAYDRVQERNRILHFSGKNGTELFCRTDQILYFERRGRCTILCTEREKHEIRESLPDILPQLPETGFARCHNSYVIAFAAIREWQRDSMIMTNGDIISVSRRYRRELQEEVMKWSLMQNL